MEIVNIEARTFEAMLSKFEVFADRMEKLCTLYGDMSQRTWWTFFIYLSKSLKYRY